MPHAEVLWITVQLCLVVTATSSMCGKKSLIFQMIYSQRQLLHLADIAQIVLAAVQHTKLLSLYVLDTLYPADKVYITINYGSIHTEEVIPEAIVGSLGLLPYRSLDFGIVLG